MTCTTKDSSCGEESTAVPNTSNISSNEILTNLEIESSSATITDPSINVSNDFKFTNRTPGTLFNHSRQNSNLISYKSSEKYHMYQNCMLVDTSANHGDGALHKKELNKNDNNLTEIKGLSTDGNDTNHIIGEERVQDEMDKSITTSTYSPSVSTSLVKFGSLDTFRSTKGTKMGMSSSYFILFNELENKCNELENKLISQNKEISIKNTELSINKDKVRNVAKMTENLKSSMHILQENLDLVQNEKMKYTKTFKLLWDENITIKNRIRCLKSEISESIKKIDSYKSKYNKFKFRLESQNLRIISLKGTVDELSGNLSEEKLKTSSLIQEISQINQSHSEHMTLLQNQLQNMLSSKLNGSVPSLIKYENSLIQESLSNISKDIQEKLNINYSLLKNDFEKCDDFSFTKFENNFQTLSSQLSSISDNISGRLDPIILQIDNRDKSFFSNLKDEILIPNFAAILNKSDSYFTKIENNLNNVNKAIYQKMNIEKDYEDKFSKIEFHLNDVTNSREEYMDKYQRLQTENDKLLKKLSILERLNFESSQKLTHANESLVSLRCNLEDSRSEIQNLKLQSQMEKEAYCKNYESQIQSYKQLSSITMDEKSRMKSEANNLLIKVAELEKYKLDFDKILTKNHSLLLEIEHSTNDLKKCHEDKQLLKNEMLIQQSKFIEKINYLSKELATLKDILEKLEEHKAKLKDNEETLAMEKHSNSAEKTKSLSLENKVSELEKTVKEITRKRKIEETKFSNNSIALKDMYEDSKKKLIVEKLKINKMEEFEKERAKEIADLKQKYQHQLELYDEIVDVNKQTCLNLENQLNESEKNCTSLRTEKVELNFKINELQSQLLKINQNNTKKREFIHAEEFPLDEYSFDNINSSVLETKRNKPNNRRQKRK